MITVHESCFSVTELPCSAAVRIRTCCVSLQVGYTHMGLFIARGMYRHYFSLALARSTPALPVSTRDLNKCIALTRGLNKCIALVHHVAFVRRTWSWSCHEVESLFCRQALNRYSCTGILHLYPAMRYRFPAANSLASCTAQMKV